MDPYPKAGPIDVPQRILMGPGPSNSHPRALAAMALPQLGHMHPPFLKVRLCSFLPGLYGYMEQ